MEKFLGASFHIELANPKIWKRNSHDLTIVQMKPRRIVKPVGNLAMADAPSRSIHFENHSDGKLSNLVGYQTSRLVREASDKDKLF